MKLTTLLCYAVFVHFAVGKSLKKEHELQKRNTKFMSLKFKMMPHPKYPVSLARDEATQTTVKYVMFVFNSCEEGAGTNANNYAQLSGVNSNNGTVWYEVYLHDGLAITQDCGIDRYQFETKEEMKNWKLHVRTDSSGGGWHWKLDTIYVYDDRGTAGFFFINKWIGAQGHYHLVPKMQTYKYSNLRVWIWTYDEASGGTDSNIRIQFGFHGGVGWTGLISLNELIDADVFERNDLSGFQWFQQFDTGLGLDKLELSSDGAWGGSGWKIGIVAVNDDKLQEYHEFKFAGNKHLDSYNSPAALERTLELISLKFKLLPHFNYPVSPAREPNRDVATPPTIKYEMIILTGCVENAGSAANTFAELTGVNYLNTTEIHEVYLRDTTSYSWQCNMARYEFTSVGELEYWAFYVRTDSSGNSPGWYLDTIYVYDDQENDGVFFSNTWIPENDMYFNVPHMEERKHTNFRLWIYTADETTAGTDSNLWIRICKTECTAGIRLNGLIDSNAFERDEINGFQFFQRDDLDDGRLITKLMLLHDGNYGGPGWRFGLIALTDDKEQMYYEFKYNAWISGTDGKYIKLDMIKQVTLIQLDSHSTVGWTLIIQHDSSRN